MPLFLEEQNMQQQLDFFDKTSSVRFPTVREN